MFNKKIFFLLFNEHYVAWLKVTKSGIDAYNYPEILTV